MRGTLTVLALLGLMALQPIQARAQADRGAGVLFDGNVGPILLGVGPCGQQSAPGMSAGVEVRNHGPWVVSAGLDLMLPGVIRTLIENVACTGPQPVTRYEGEWADIVGAGSSHPLVRLALGFGRAIPGLPLQPVLSAGGGFIPTNTYFGTTVAEPRVDRTDFSWEPWIGARLRLQAESIPVGLRVEVGKHRLRKRLYAQNEDRLLAEIHDWPWMIGTAFSVSIRR
jgi:hypothetical protein